MEIRISGQTGGLQRCSSLDWLFPTLFQNKNQTVLLLAGTSYIVPVFLSFFLNQKTTGLIFGHCTCLKVPGYINVPTFHFRSSDSCIFHRGICHFILMCCYCTCFYSCTALGWAIVLRLVVFSVIWMTEIVPLVISSQICQQGAVWSNWNWPLMGNGANQHSHCCDNVINFKSKSYRL